MMDLKYGSRLKTPLLTSGDPEHKRQELKKYFHQTFSIYEDLFTLLSKDESYYARADPLRHPLIFYYGHTACFFINKLVATKLWSDRVDPLIESTCAVGVDELTWDDLDQNSYNWPTVLAVRDYRNKVRAVVNSVIEKMPMKIPVTWDDPAWIILMGIEHERVHLETSSVLIRQLPLDMVHKQPRWSICPLSGTPPTNQLLPVSAGTVDIGKCRYSTKYYGWDNEFGQQVQNVASFSAAAYKVTNHEFEEFVATGGYEEEKWWQQDGWRWVQFQQAAMPRFWIKTNSGQMKLRCLVEVIDMPWDWPVEVNYFEAKAFCNWLAAKTNQPIRLPTEAEWLLLRNSEVPEMEYPHWSAECPGNIDLAYFASSCPVTKFKHGRFYDLLGNCWEWSESAISGLAGFEPHPAYDDFSTPTFDGDHHLIKGGSWVTTGNAALHFSRYAFRRHFYQHAGFRYIRSTEKAK